MQWLEIDDELIPMEGDSIKSRGEIPAGFYKSTFEKNKGTFLKKTSIKISHGKIYGNSQNIAEHIVSAYEMSSKEKNLGVLLSGGRGLGKTLTTRLVIEQLKDKYPIIVISEYTPDLSDFLSYIKNAVILMDEFEKFMGGNIRGNDAEDEQTKQETILSVLDGNTGCSGNLFLLTANDVYRIDENLKSRPGRIRYHYKYESESSNVVREYCKDNLERKDIIEDVVKCLSVAKYVSLDIISSFVDELNKFSNLTPLQAMEFFNIESSNNLYKIKIKTEISGEIIEYERKFKSYLDCSWCNVAPSYRKKYINNELIPTSICCSLDAENIPTYFYEKTNIDPDNISIHDIDGVKDDLVDSEDVKVLSVIIEDAEFESFSKKFNKGTF